MVMQWTVNPPSLTRLVRSQDTPPNNWNGPIMVLEQIANLSACVSRSRGSSPRRSANFLTK
jgi:hypothetical protein